VEVPILKQGLYLIASIQSALTDADLTQLRESLGERVGKCERIGASVGDAEQVAEPVALALGESESVATTAGNVDRDPDDGDGDVGPDRGCLLCRALYVDGAGRHGSVVHR
jgi:hypothetical protein